MQAVKVSRVSLLLKIRENRVKHEEIHRKAVAGYQEAVKAALNKWDNLLNHKAVIDAVVCVEAVKEIGLMRPPEHHLGEYDQTISMLEMSVDEEVVLQVHEFQQLVLDEWAWKRDFIAHSATYAR